MLGGANGVEFGVVGFGEDGVPGDSRLRAPVAFGSLSVRHGQEDSKNQQSFHSVWDGLLAERYNEAARGEFLNWG